MPNYVQLPGYNPGNQMINFDPLNKGIDAIVAGEKQGYDRTNATNFGNAMAANDPRAAMIAGAKIDPRLAMDAGLYGGKVQAQQNELALFPDKLKEVHNAAALSTAKLIAGQMQTFKDMPEGPARDAAVDKWFSSHDSDPEFAKDLKRIGVSDWRANPAQAVDVVHSTALGAQNADQQAFQRAQTAKANREKYGPDETVASFGPNAAQPQTLVQGGTTLKTQEQREAAANKLGLQPGSEPYKQLMVNGRLPDHDLPPREASIVDQNTKAIQAMDMISQKLDDAKNYNKEAFQGAGAGARAATVQSLPWFMPDEWRKGANATDQMRILETGRALGQAKTDAGARVTAYLEQLEMKLRGSPDMPQETRAELMDEAKKFIAQNRQLVYGQTQAILNRTAFKPGGMINPKDAPSGDGIKPAPTVLDEARKAIQSGANPDAVKQRLQKLGIDPGQL
jgi:hypothetical protein